MLAEVDYVARNTAFASLAVAVLALVVAIAAAVFARRQAEGQLGGNTPTIEARTSKSAANGAGTSGSLKLTFTARDQIKTAVVTIRDGSDMTEVGAPDGGPLGRSVTLTEIPLGTEIELPAKFVDGKTAARITVTMTGAIFGTRTLPIDVDSTDPFFFVY